MKNIIIFAALLLTVSCQKVIDLKVKDADKKYVIEANVTDQPGPYTVTISNTTSFNSSWQFQGVGGAAVTIKDNAGNSELLHETETGVYQTSTFAGVPGRTYDLHVTIGEKTFTSTSTMPLPVSFDSLYVREIVNFTKTVKAAVPIFTDPKGQGNSYKFNQYINGRLDKALYYQNDDFTDGQMNTFALLQDDPDSTLHTNDKLEVDMQCIDKAAYKYWFSLDESSSGEGNSIPANPVTNIQGGALGYFSAHTSQRRSLTVK